MTMTMRMTYHAKVERIDRIVACVQHLGFNEIVVEAIDHKNPGRRFLITDTGIILVMAAEENVLITAYMGTLNKVVAICGGTVPPALKKRVISNEKKYKFLMKM